MQNGGREKDVSERSFTEMLKNILMTLPANIFSLKKGLTILPLLYIPAENVYYETITKDESFGEEKGILNYALTKEGDPCLPELFLCLSPGDHSRIKGIADRERCSEDTGLAVWSEKRHRRLSRGFSIGGKTYHQCDE